MKNASRGEVLNPLRTTLEETVLARELTATGQAIPAMRALLRAKRLGRQSIGALLGGCLGATVARVDEASLARLMELIGFAQQALCLGCRGEVGKRWKEAEDV